MEELVIMTHANKAEHKKRTEEPKPNSTGLGSKIHASLPRLISTPVSLTIWNAAFGEQTPRCEINTVQRIKNPIDMVINRIVDFDINN